MAQDDDEQCEEAEPFDDHGRRTTLRKQETKWTESSADGLLSLETDMETALSGTESSERTFVPRVGAFADSPPEIDTPAASLLLRRSLLLSSRSMAVAVRKVVSPVDKKAPRLHGGTPDTELVLSPRWIVFSSADGYRTPQMFDVTITNADQMPVVFRLRTKSRWMPGLSRAHGFLKPGESTVVTVFLTTAIKWSRDPSDVAGRRHRVLCESLTVEQLKPPNDADALQQWVRDIFRHTAADRPFTRVYTKLNFFLPKVGDDWVCVSA
uniref:MSP domain-containing protein n=1 Tax=Steinernema glaseri TaxID=37863 RepID=A0A1I7ZI98_9BILA